MDRAIQGDSTPHAAIMAGHTVQKLAVDPPR
jgi:hypothetical protein